MREKTDDKFTVRVADTLQKTLHSRDSAERLVRAVISLWRDSTDGPRKSAGILVLDFQGIEQISESAAGVIAEFRDKFSEDKDPEIIFSNMSSSIREIIEAAERSVLQSARKLRSSKKKRGRFTIKI